MEDGVNVLVETDIFDIEEFYKSVAGEYSGKHVFAELPKTSPRDFDEIFSDSHCYMVVPDSDYEASYNVELENWGDLTGRGVLASRVFDYVDDLVYIMELPNVTYQQAGDKTFQYLHNISGMARLNADRAYFIDTPGVWSDQDRAKLLQNMDDVTEF